MNQNEALRDMANFSQESDQLTSPKKALFRVVDRRRCAVLAGPPGTGKTKMLLELKNELMQESKLGVCEMVQFHREYSYQDFIEGYQATSQGFVPKEGIFKKFIMKVEERRSNESDQDSKIDLFLIDEMNRADVGSVFGELLTLLDDASKKIITLPRTGKEIRFYSSIVIVGTMNTADKSIALLDFAFRRRFAFIFTPPDYQGLREWLNMYGFSFTDFTVEDYIKAVRTLNHRITLHPMLGKGMMLGQSLFVPHKKENISFTVADITEVMNEQVLPQLEAYLGLGAQRELDKLIGIDLRQKIEAGIPISDEDLVGFVRVSANDKDVLSK